MEIHSFYDGPHGQRRYCTLYRPQTRLTRGAVIVLCPPVGHEYFRCYRAFRIIAEQLVKCGFTAMCFDYRGTGDSEGDACKVRLADWLEDIETAIATAQRITGITSVALVGLRLGATMAALVAKSNNDVKTLVLWDPVMDGRRYIEEMRDAHRAMLRDLDRFRRPRRAEDTSDYEFLGSSFAPEFIGDIDRIDPMNLTHAFSQGVVLIQSDDHDNEPTQALRRDKPARYFTEYRLPATYGWREPARIEEAIVDPVVTQHIATSMNAVHL